DRLRAGLQTLDEMEKTDAVGEAVERMAYFCSGCPHNSSTKLPEGARAYAGIGCHYMVQWMDRETLGFTHMGGEGANWIGEAPFSTRDHVFQNLGDGTYNHSGSLAIRAAIATGTKMTYKILYNDAVAMTGGQSNEGDLDAYRIVREVLAMGVAKVEVVYDPKEGFDPGLLPAGVRSAPRDELPNVQRRLSQIDGVTVLVYVQTCAAEKRRRRKRGTFPDPDKRIFINTDICEGCGDCGIQSNCVSIVPVETELGRKRAIDQSSCNKDFSCVNGFCPSFVTLEGAVIRKEATASIDLPDLPEPELPEIGTTHNAIITGVGGTGVVTVGAVLAMAAHIDGKGVGMMEMAGLAQKGGAVHIHCRIAKRAEDISAIRVANGECDVLIGGDLVVSAGTKTMALMGSGRTGAVVNSHEIITGDFTRNAEFRLPINRLQGSLKKMLKDRLQMFDASELSKRLMGDSIFSNMMIFGAAWQAGLIPVSEAAILRAIALNGAKVEQNETAFRYGRWAAAHPKAVAELLDKAKTDAPGSLDDRIAFRAAHLQIYQSRKLAERYLGLLRKIEDVRLKEAVA
ncbi:MAG: 2-oxoacid:acceptor oxidoreductase family protein, partial [Pseudomonadota bacterium]